MKSLSKSVNIIHDINYNMLDPPSEDFSVLEFLLQFLGHVPFDQEFLDE
jgi:hypothetical protein